MKSPMTESPVKMRRPIVINRGLRVLAVVVVVLTAAACSGESNQGLYADIGESAAAGEPGESAAVAQLAATGTQPAPVTVAPLPISPDVADGDLAGDDLASLRTWFDSILALRDQFYIGQATVGDLEAHVSAREPLFAASELQAEYLALLANESAIATEQIASFSNITSARVERGAIVFDDCMEQQRLSSIGIVGFSWIQQTATIRYVDGQWKVLDLIVTHDGAPWTAGFGCAPPSFAERAEIAATSFVDELAAYRRAPETFNALAAFDQLADQEFRVNLTADLQGQVDQGLVLQTGEEIDYRVLGINVEQSLVDWLVAVEVCVRYPDGLAYGPAGGAPTIVDSSVQPGSSVALQMLVSLGQVNVGTPTSDSIAIAQPGDLDCWER